MDGLDATVFVARLDHDPGVMFVVDAPAALPGERRMKSAAGASLEQGVQTLATTQTNMSEYMESIDHDHEPGRNPEPEPEQTTALKSREEETWDGTSLDPLFTSDGSLREPGTVTKPVEFYLEQLPHWNPIDHVDPIEDDDDGDDGGEPGAVCPKCGAENVEMHTEILQTRSADESGTEITKTSCGCTFRRVD